MKTFRDGGLVVALCLVAMVAMSTIGGTNAALTTHFYDHSCPQIYSIVKAEVQKAVAIEARNAASLVRLHFHDCFVNVSNSFKVSLALNLLHIQSTDARFRGTNQIVVTGMRRFSAVGQRHRSSLGEVRYSECELRQSLRVYRRHQSRAGTCVPSDGLLRRHPGNCIP
jgi:hypothetical protein